MTSRPPGSIHYNNQGRIILVSGGSNGIGRSICEQFALSQAHVVCMDVDASSEGDLPENVHFQQGDTSQEEDCLRVVSETVDRFGGLDVLVNNAAIQPPESYVRLDELTRDAWDRMVAVNFSGYTFLAKHAVKVMLSQGSGVIVNIASGQAHRTARQVPCYGPIKAGNLLQTMQWGVEYARRGIRVVSVSPGAVRTPLVEASLKLQGGEEQLANRHPIGRIAQPEEVAHAVLWLASGDASFVTATDLQVDGGLGALGAFAYPYPPSS